MAVYDKHRYITIPVVITFGVLLAAASMRLYQQSLEIDQNAQLVTLQEQDIEKLQRQLVNARAVNNELQGELQQLRTDLDHTEALLDDLRVLQDQSDRQQSRYLQSRKQSEQRLHIAQAEHERLQRALRYRQNENRSLKQNLSGLTAHLQLLQEKITGLEADYEQVSLLNAELEKKLTKPVQQPEVETPATTKNTVVTGEKTHQYRMTRLQSLQRALANRDSVTRRNILMDVLPTIPSGFSAAELLPLVAGMQSGDILAVIQGVADFVQRPIDNASLSTLVTTMNDEDAVTASLILSDN